MQEIETRRSIRRYQNKEVPEALVKQVLQAAIQAPSAKNRQPWKFLVVSGEAKRDVISIMYEGLDKEQRGQGLLPESAQHLNSARQTVKIMEEAPVLIFVLDTEGRSLYEELSIEEKVYEKANLQSISAAVQNMLLEATRLGLGSLWICDVFFAYDGLSEWIGNDGELVCAVSMGYPAHSPAKRPRKLLEEVTGYR